MAGQIARDNPASSRVRRAHKGPATVGPESHGERRRWAPQVVAVVALGLLVTAAVSTVSWTIDRRNEHRLLQVQTSQAAAVIASSALALTDPLRAAAEVAAGTDGDAAHFRTAVSSLTGKGAPFAAVELWQAHDGAAPTRVTSVGADTVLTPTSPQAAALIKQAQSSPTFLVTPIGTAGVQRVGYLVPTAHDRRFLVYAERAIPPNRQVEVERGSAFADLHFATYLGTSTAAANLATTDVAPSRLPLTGQTAREVIPFGNSSITLVTEAKGPLGGSFGRDLPWILLLGGILITCVAGATTYQLVSRRSDAEQSERTITDLYAKLDAQYGQQRSIAYGLQQALLPAYNPAIRGLQVASRYAAGAEGVDIGGDWYSLIALDDTRFGFVVGDVSGRGISAATVMARLRFTMRAYLIEGHSPDHVLEMCSRQLDLEVDGHFATVIVGVGDTEARTLTLASAGHFDPLLISGDHPEFAPTKSGLPLGITPCSYEATTIVMTEGSTFLAFTDGLVERRGESIDVGLERLAAAAAGPVPDLDQMLSHLLDELTSGQAEDDVAMLAFRWTSPNSPHTQPPLD